jgi:parallel beta-helix repeat protein
VFQPLAGLRAGYVRPAGNVGDRCQIGTGLGNTLSNNLSAPSRLDFAGTGIRAQGLLTGTVVAGNNFTGNNYGFAFIGAQNLRLERNTFTRNNVAGIYIEGDSRGSVQTGNSFGGPRQDRNKAHVLRARGSQFGGRPVVPRP